MLVIILFGLIGEVGFLSHAFHGGVVGTKTVKFLFYNFFRKSQA